MIPEIAVSVIYLNSTAMICNAPVVYTISVLLVQVTVNGISLNDNSIDDNHTLLHTDEFPTISPSIQHLVRSFEVQKLWSMARISMMGHVHAILME